MRVVDLTRLDASIMYNPNRDIMEERKLIQDYSIKQTYNVITRTRLLLILAEWLVNCDMFVFYFFYPRFSYTCWFFMQLSIYYYDPQYILTYLLLILIWLVGAQSQFWEENISPRLQKMFFE